MNKNSTDAKEAVKQKVAKEKTEKKGDGREPIIRERKKEEPVYVLRQNRGMKVARIVFWVMLIFIFIRGVATIFKPDNDDVVKKLIQDFKADYSEFSNQNAEVMAFAQCFAKEYLTYQVRGETDYKQRLTPYVTSAFLNNAINDCKGTARATYVEAYRVEEYSENQVDVYVLAEMEYESRILGEDGRTYTTEISTSQIVLKVPVYMQDNFYIVENLPLMVTDSQLLTGYKVPEYTGTALSEEKTDKVTISVKNFLKAYFEQDDSVINYYLSGIADKEDFSGLDGRFSFIEIETINCYQEEGGDIICLVTFKIKDTENNVEMLQKINLFMQESGGKFYINSMDTRTGNLNIQ